MVNKMSETKRMHYTNNAQGIATGVNYNTTALNPFQPFFNGELQNDIIGNEIDVRYFELRYYIYHTSSTVNDVAVPTFVRWTLVKSPQVWALGSPTAPYIPETNMPFALRLGTGATMPITNTKFNSNVVKVLWQKTIRLGPPPFGPTNVRYGKIKPRGLKGKKTFMGAVGSNISNTNGQIRQGQYYLICDMWTRNNATASNNILMTYDFSLYYKDM